MKWTFPLSTILDCLRSIALYNSLNMNLKHNVLGVFPSHHTHLERSPSSRAFDIPSSMVAKSEENRFVGRSTRSVRLDNFQTSRCL